MFNDCFNLKIGWTVSMYIPVVPLGFDMAYPAERQDLCGSCSLLSRDLLFYPWRRIVTFKGLPNAYNWKAKSSWPASPTDVTSCGSCRMRWRTLVFFFDRKWFLPQKKCMQISHDGRSTCSRWRHDRCVSCNFTKQCCSGGNFDTSLWSLQLESNTLHSSKLLVLHLTSIYIMSQEGSGWVVSLD